MTAEQRGDVAAWLDRLEEARAATLPGPWNPATAPAEGSTETHAEYLANALDPEAGRPLWVLWADAGGRAEAEGLVYVVPVVTGDGPKSEANARYIAAMHAAVPQLVAAIRGVLDLADRHDDDADAFDALASGYSDQHLDEDARRCEERAEQYRDAADKLRAVTAALTDGTPR